MSNKDYLESLHPHTRTEGTQIPVTQTHSLIHAHNDRSITRALDRVAVRAKQLFREWNPGGCEFVPSRKRKSQCEWGDQGEKQRAHVALPGDMNESTISPALPRPGKRGRRLRVAEHLPSILLFCTRCRCRRRRRAFKLITRHRQRLSKSNWKSLELRDTRTPILSTESARVVSVWKAEAASAPGGYLAVVFNTTNSTNPNHKIDNVRRVQIIRSSTKNSTDLGSSIIHKQTNYKTVEKSADFSRGNPWTRPLRFHKLLKIQTINKLFNKKYLMDFKCQWLLYIDNNNKNTQTHTNVAV